MKARTVVIVASSLVLGACASDNNTATTDPSVTVASSSSAATDSTPTTNSAETIGSTSGTASSGDTVSTTDSAATVDTTDTSTNSSEEATVDSGDVDQRIEVAGQALADGDFTLMLDVLNLSGVADEIRDRQVTVFAPNDDAFKSLTGEEYSDLVTNPTKVDDLVRRHIVDGLLTYDDLGAMSEVETIGGEKLTVTNTGGVVTVGGATVIEPKTDALSGDNGQEVVVFGIDQVLLEAS